MREWSMRSKCTATLAEKRRAFVADALAAENEVKETGLVYRAVDVHLYIRGLSVVTGFDVVIFTFRDGNSRLSIADLAQSWGNFSSSTRPRHLSCHRGRF